jgi:hypothetical protein
MLAGEYRCEWLRTNKLFHRELFVPAKHAGNKSQIIIALRFKRLEMINIIKLKQNIDGFNNGNETKTLSTNLYIFKQITLWCWL